MTRGGAVVARRAHNPEVMGSNPIPANLFFELVGAVCIERGTSGVLRT